MKLLVVVAAVTVLGCQSQAVELVWDDSDWKPILSPCPTCRQGKAINDKVVARSPQGRTVPAPQGSSDVQITSLPSGPFIKEADLVHTLSSSFVREASVSALRPNKPQGGKSDRRKPSLVPSRRAQSQRVSSGGVQLIYLPEGSLQQLSSARAARIIPTRTPLQKSGDLLEVSPQPLPEFVQNVGFSDKQKRDQSGRIISGGVSNALPVSILTTPDQQQEAKEKLRLLEAALTAPEENQPNENGRLPRVFIAPSHVAPPPGYVKIPLVPHGEPGASTIPSGDGKLPQTFLTSDKSSPPPGFIKIDLPEGVSQLSRGIPVVVPNDLPPRSSSERTRALEILGANRQARTSKSQRPTVQTLQREEAKFASTPLPPLREQQESPRRPSPARGQPRFPSRPEQPPNFLQFSQPSQPLPRPNQAVSRPNQPKQPFPEQPQFIAVFPPLPTQRPAQKSTLQEQSLPRPVSTPRPLPSSVPEEPFSFTEQPLRRPNQPITQTDRPFTSKETTSQTSQLLPQSNQPSEPQKPIPQAKRPILQSAHRIPQIGQSFLQFGRPSRPNPSDLPLQQPDKPSSQPVLSSQQPDRPFQPNQPFPQPGQPFQRQPGQPFPRQPSQPFPQPGQPFPQPGQSFPQQGQPFPQPGQLFPQQGQPFPQPGQSPSQPGQPFPQPNQLLPQQGQPFPPPGRSPPQPGQPDQPFPRPGQLSPLPGQPFTQPGQPGQNDRPFSQPKQPDQPFSQTRPPFTQPDQPIDHTHQPPSSPRQSFQQDEQTFPQPSQPFPQPGQPSPQPGHPFPQPDQSTPQPGQHSQPPLEPDQSTSQPDQSTPQPGQSGHRSQSPLQPGQVFPQPGKPFSQSRQPGKIEQSIPQQEQPFPQPGQSFSRQPGHSFSQQPGQSFSQQSGQSFPQQPGQSFSQQSGQSFSQQSGQSFPQQPGQTFARQPGHPLAQPNRPFLQPGQPPRPPGQVFLRPDQSPSQPTQPDPASEFTLPQTGQSFPQGAQSSPPRFSQPNQSFPQSDPPFSQTLPHFGPPPRQPFNTSPTPPITTPLNSESTPESEVRPSTLQATLRPRFTSPSTQRQSSTFDTTPRPILTSPSTQRPSSTFQPTTNPGFTTRFTQRPSTIFQTTPRPNFISQSTPKPSSTFRSTPRPNFVSQSPPRLSSTFQPSLSPNFIPQSTQRPHSFQPTPRPSFTSPSTTQRITPASRPSFPSLSTPHPRFPSNSFVTQDEENTSEPPFIPHSSPFTTPSPAFPKITNPLDTASGSQALSIPGAVSHSPPRFASSVTPRPFSTTVRPQTVSFEESSKPSSLSSKKPFVSSTLRPQPVSFSGFPSPLPTSIPKPQPVSPTPRPLRLPTFAPFGSVKRPPSRQSEDKRPKQFPHDRIPSFRDPQESLVSQPQAPRRPNFAPFQPPSLTSTQIEEQTTPFQPEDTTERFLSTVSSAQPSTTTTTTPRVTTFKPRFDFNIANRRPFLRRKQQPNNPPNKEDEGAVKKEADTTLKKDVGEKKTETVTLFPPFSVARTLNPLLAQKEGANDEETSDGVRVPPTGVFGRRLKPRTRRPLNRPRSEDSVTDSDPADEDIPVTGTATRLDSQNRGRVRSQLGLRGRELPEWLKARRRNRGRGRLRGTEAPKETENEQLEDAPVDILENNGFNAAESTVVEFSSPFENRVAQPLSPHDALKQLAEDAAEDIVVKEIVEHLDTAGETVVDHVTYAGEKIVETGSLGRLENPQEHSEDFVEQPAFSARFREIKREPAEEPEHIYNEPEPETKAEPEPELDGEPEPEAEPEPEPVSELEAEPEPKPKAEVLDDGATTEPEPEPQHQPQYVSEDDLPDKPETPLPHYRFSRLPSSPSTLPDPLKPAPISSPAFLPFPRQLPSEPSVIQFSDPSTENHNSRGSWNQTQKDQEAVAPESINDPSNSDHNDRVTVGVASTHNIDEGARDPLGYESDISYYHVTTEFPETSSLFPNDHFTTLSPGESEDYYSYEYDDLYDDPAEQSKDQKFGGSSAQVVFAVPVTKYVPELVLTTTPAAERVEAFSEATNSEMTIFEGSQVTAEGSQWATETPQVTSSPEDTSHMLRETTVTQVTEEVPQTTDVPEVTDEMVEVTEEVMVTEVVPQMTTEDAVAETITESPVTSETTLMPDDTTTEREGAVHQSHADGTSSTPKPAAPVITFLPFPFTTTTTPTTTSTTTSRPRPVSIRPLHARLLNAGKKKVSPSVASAKKDSGALKIVAKSTVAEIQSSDPVICFPGHPCVRAVGVGRLLPP